MIIIIQFIFYSLIILLHFASMIIPKQFTQLLCSDIKYSLKDSMDVKCGFVSYIKIRT